MMNTSIQQTIKNMFGHWRCLILGMMRITLSIILLISGLVFAVSANAQNETSPLGINIRAIKYWDTEIHTVDFFKRSGNGSQGLWLTQCAGCPWDTREQAALDLDSQGWPRSLPDATASNVQYRYVTTLPVWGTGHYPAGQYTVFYEGEGQLAYGGDAVRNDALSRPGREIIDITPYRGFNVSIRVTDPKHTGNYLRNIRIIAPGGTCYRDPSNYATDVAACPDSFQAFTETYMTQPFHPLFLADMKPFSALRFVHFAAVITSQVREWEERPQLDYASWGANVLDGAPIELAIDLANTLNASPWLEVPAMASDDYIAQFARLTKSRYTVNRPIYLEYHNEAWNSAYPYSLVNDWIEQQGVARWKRSSRSAYDKRINWFAMRTADVCRIWKREFGDRAGQVKCVMASQSANAWVSTTALSCPLYAQESGHNCAGQIDALAIAPYFGDYISQPAFQVPVTAWLAEPDGGMNSLFQEITQGLLPLTTPLGNNQPVSSLAQIIDQMHAQKALADTYNLQLAAYEGTELLVVPNTNGYLSRLQTLFAAASRDSRMKAVYQTLFDNWRQAGGTLFMVFESTGMFDAINGNSTLLEYQGQPRDQAPKYDATLSFISANPCWWLDCSLRFSLTHHNDFVPTQTTLTWIPDDADRNITGEVYVAAFWQGSVYMLTTGGWAVSDPQSSTHASFVQGPLAQSTRAIASGLDLSSLPGLQIWAGYGKGVGSKAYDEMLSAVRYQKVYPITGN